MAAETLLRRQADAVIGKMLLTDREAAAAVSLCPKSLYLAVKRGDLRCVRIGRAVRYAPADLVAWIEGMKGGDNA